jgi:hypothetical protein
VYVRLLVRSKAGKYSTPSATTGPTPTGLVQLGDLGFNVAQYGGGSTIYFTVHPDQPSAPSWGFSVGDLWLEQIGTSDGLNGNPPIGTPLYQTSRWLGSQWALLHDQGVSNSLAAAIAAQTLANSKVSSFTQDSPPIWTGLPGSAFWIDTSLAGGNVTKVWNGSGWTPYQLGNGAIQPNSLIASNVIATGSVTAALLEAQMVLTNAVIAGDPKGNNATLRADGLHFFQKTAGGQGSVEVGRMGTGTSDFLGLVDSGQNLVATIDDTGAASFTNLNVAGDPIVEGNSLMTRLGRSSGGGGPDTTLPGARHWYGWANAGISGVVSEVGLIEMAVNVDAGRMYYVVPSIYYARNTSTYLIMTVRDGGTGTPDTSSPVITLDYFANGEVGNTVIAERFRLWQPATSGVHRLLVTAAAGGSSSINVVDTDVPPTLSVIDLGPSYGNPASVNRGGGGTPAPLQQYYVELTPTSYSSYDGGGTLRTDTTDIVQGYDPLGQHGDGGGFWTFSIPSITGTINRMDWFVNVNWTYNTSGGSAIWNCLSSGAGSNYVSHKLKSDDIVGGYPARGPLLTTLPSGWYSSFVSSASPKAVSISAGPSGGTNETYYVRFDGPSARLRIYYTQ